MATTSGTKQFWNLEHSDAFLYCYWKHMAHVQPNLKFGNGIPRRRHIGRDSVDRQAQAERSWYVRFIGNESTRSLAGYFGASSRGTAAQGGGEGFRGGSQSLAMTLISRCNALDKSFSKAGRTSLVIALRIRDMVYSFVVVWLYSDRSNGR